MIRAAATDTLTETAMLRSLAIVVGIVWAVLAASSAAQADRRVALVIGNSSYSNTSPLRNPKNDANDLAATLKQVGFEVFLGLDLDQRGFGTMIEQFARELEGADVGLLFYAGHALQINEKNYLVSINARLENEFLIASEAIELEPIVRLMESKTQTNLIFLDACRNNPLAENLRRNLAAMKRSANLGRGLARMEPSTRDTLIAFAAAPGQEAADGQDKNSPFTAALLRHIPQPGVEVSVMLKEVAADVRRETRNAQRPQQLSDMSRTFYFAGTPAAVARVVEKPAPAATPGPDRTLDVAYWSSAQASNDCDSVRAYIQRFPDGAFIDLAKLAERRLCPLARRVTATPEPTPGVPDDSAPRLTPAPPVMAATPAPAVAPAVQAPREQTTSPRPEPAPQPNIAALPEIAALPPEAPAPAVATQSDLARNIQLELFRLGCARGDAEGEWNADAKDAVRKFNRYAKAKLDINAPSQEMMVALRDHDKRICPLECGPGTRARGDMCVAVERADPPRARKAEPEPRERKRRETSRAPAERAATSRGPATKPAGSVQAEFNNPLCTSRIQMPGGKWCCSYDPPRGATVIICR
jgi:hypothetical protein